MSNYIFESQFQNESSQATVRLILFHFIDENDIHFVYSPFLDLSGYGQSEREAKASFKIAFSDFISYTMNKKTLAKVLKELGWKVKGSLKSPKKISMPDMATSIKNKKYISELFNKYPIQTYHQEVAIPA